MTNRWRQHDRNELISKKHKKVCRVLNYIEHSLVLISTITGCISISAFTANRGAETVAVNNTNKKVIFKNFAPFTDYITEINNTQIDDA